MSFDYISEKENGPRTEEIGSVLGKIRILKVLGGNSSILGVLALTLSNIIPSQPTKVGASQQNGHWRLAYDVSEWNGCI